VEFGGGSYVMATAQQGVRGAVLRACLAVWLRVLFK